MHFVLIDTFSAWGVLHKLIVVRCKSEWRTNIGTKVIDNNLSFFEPVLIFSYRLFFEPFVHKPNECIYATHTNRCFLIT